MGLIFPIKVRSLVRWQLFPTRNFWFGQTRVPLRASSSVFVFYKPHWKNICFRGPKKEIQMRCYDWKYVP